MTFVASIKALVMASSDGLCMLIKGIMEEVLEVKVTAIPGSHGYVQYMCVVQSN